ncbi:serine/threonine protein kinase [Tolypothrix sp. LEGE 11397]|uniref:serine/threonine protein kinase n=1 Tax=unclassified Tolypothrix TaxID=2649714 RepID=UPI000B60BF60|nr:MULTISPECIES: serine/threonine-protein kinase [unclassified Tolypothrix]MBE9084406.1 serine/threonine protein kinase [Tolypothrix sp. LEGE 11397]UYD29040.1 serine/threonine protein kinase [Tolypothrix sp. PCC 7712]UYD35046.1 serine/threonine protein kinase [Tolypothrix sp. PCC 7601]BAY88354.1 serine/threonine protein kinase [Microchaete diplosiphon NIES-3275]
MPWIAGQQLQSGKYVIEQVLGQGGFGITYKALHVELKQTVVIKTPNEYLSHDPEYDKYIERFIQEGRILARLSQDPHPHIVGVIDLFQEGATHCLVMDFVEGENLFEAVRRKGALPEAEILPCIRQIGEALRVVHQAGLVHRDAHPGNIMVRRNGKAVLIDFGIAKSVIPSTISSINKDGNQAFAPYEQMSSGSREPTVDVYCLAATLYYAVTGQRPTPSLARKLDDVSLTPPQQIVSNISDRLNQVILKGMALEAKDRPQSMQAWLAMLKASKAIPTPRVEPVYRTEVPHFKTPLKSKATPDKRATKLTRIIPWGWLIGVLLSYLPIGYLLAASNAPYIIWAVAVAVAVAVAWAGAGTWDVTVAMAVALAGAVAVAVAVGVARAGAGAWAVALAVALAVVVVVAVAVIKLLESFSRFHTILILASTSTLGLGLGWLEHRIFNIGT